jgi:hypothetical protein
MPNGQIGPAAGAAVEELLVARRVFKSTAEKPAQDVGLPSETMKLAHRAPSTDW